MIKLLTVLGARPQFIKASTISRVISERQNIAEVIVHTGQHFDSNMSEVFFDQMNIPKPKYNLGIASGTHGSNTGRMLEAIENVLLIEKPDGVIVFGDTNSTLAGALAARKIQIPVFHIEAGLRSYNMAMPEEVNRILTDRISDLLFCPTAVSVSNLMREGFAEFPSKIEEVGDVMYDAAKYFEKLAIIPEHKNHLLVTVHRESNVTNPTVLSQIVKGLNTLAASYKIVFPVHPRTRKAIEGLEVKTEFVLKDPVGFFEMIGLIKTSDIVLTDSGGLQKEAFFYQKNCVILREETEWEELTKNKYAILVGNDRDKIVHAVMDRSWANVDFNNQLFGDGFAADKIVNSIEDFHEKKN